MAGRTIAYDRALGISDRVTSRVSYSTHPPRSGPHAPLAAQDGDYAGVSTPLTELLMHPLEHGRVRIQYRPGLRERPSARSKRSSKTRRITCCSMRTRPRCGLMWP